MRELRTNEDLLKDLMNYSKYGMFCQFVVMDALQQGIDTIVSRKQEYLDKEKKDEENGRISIVSHKAFVECAEDIQQRMKEFYRRDKKQV